MAVLTAIDQLPWLFYSGLLLLGLCVGSFLNVVTCRLPVMMARAERAYCGELLGVRRAPPQPARFDLLQPGSHCPHCHHPIRPWNNIPLLSFLLLRGRCGDCGAPISLRYPAIEIASGLLLVALGQHFGGASLPLLGAMLFTWTLLALAVIDLDQQLLPDSMTLPLLWLGLLFNLAGTYTAPAAAVIGAMAGYLSLWSVYRLFKLLTGREGMGYGDFKLLAAIGAWLGWQLLPLVILLASLAGAAVGLFLLIARRRGWDLPLPFGPFLAAAGWTAFLWGADIMAWYWRAAGLP